MGAIAKVTRVDEPSSVALSPARPFGPYTLVQRLGHGGGATVFVAVGAQDGESGVLVVKRLHEHLNEDTASRRRFLREAQLCKRLRHPSIVRTLASGEADGRAYIALEYLVGRDLGRVAKVLQSQGRAMPPALVARLAVDVLDGLHYAHEQCDELGDPLGIVHRDVTPQNLFVTYDGVVKVLDFGIAKVTAGTTRTSTGVVRGKLGYIAPEQARGAEVDRRADLFSMGVVMWELLAGSDLFAADGDFAAMAGSLSATVPPLVDARADVPAEIARVVERALRREPDDRYQSAAEMRLDLLRWLDAHPCPSEELGVFLRELLPREVEEDLRFADSVMRRTLAPQGVRSGPRRAILGLALLSAMLVAGLVWRPPVEPSDQRPGATADSTAVPLAPVIVEPQTTDAATYEAQAHTEDTGSEQRTAESPPGTATEAVVEAPSAVAVESAVLPKKRRGKSRAVGPRRPASRDVRREREPQGATGEALQPGYLTLVSDPWSLVTIGDRQLGNTPLVNLPLPPGDHVLTLHEPTSGATRTVHLQLRSSEKTTRRVRFEAPAAP